MDTQKGGDEQADTGQDRMHQIQQRSREHEQEFQWLGHAGQEGGDRNGQQHPANHWATRFRRSRYIASAAPQTKHHDWEEARHEHARGAVACVEAVDITVEYRAGRVGELTNLEPAMVFST